MLENQEAIKLVGSYRKNLELAKWPFLKGISKLKLNNLISTEEENYALQCLNPAHITTRSSGKIQELQLGASFRILLSNYILEKKFLEYKIAPGINDKIADSKFLEKNGFSTPKIYNEKCFYIDVKKYDNCIIKPVSGSASRGVFIKHGNSFKHIYDKSKLNLEEFIRFSIDNNFKDYLVEELVNSQSNTHDFKFYMFYGKPGVILEIDRSNHNNKYCYYDDQGNMVNTGKYEDMLFIGEGFSQEMLDVATRISKLIPSPFIRVDLLGDRYGFKVGELTAHPGGYENFNHEWDYKLGKLFIEARANLFNSLVDRVSFDSYLSRYE